MGVYVPTMGVQEATLEVEMPLVKDERRGVRGALFARPRTVQLRVVDFAGQVRGSASARLRV